ALAAEALVWMGDPAQARELLRKAYGGNARLRILVAQAATLFGEPGLAKDLATLVTRESKSSPQACTRQLTDLSLSSDDPKRSCALLASQFNDLAKPLDAARACGTDARCWLERLKDPDPEVRARAAYELGRAGAAEAAAALASAAADEQVVVRSAATR